MIGSPDDVILRALLRFRELSVSEVAGLYGLDRADVRDRLRAMRRSGEVTTSEGWWRLTEAGMRRLGESVGEAA